MNGGLYSLGPCNRDQFDISVHVTDSKDAFPACFEVRINGDAAILIELQLQPFECVLRREELNLNDSQRAPTFSPSLNVI
jgi:hypothetical protein